ncbi:hypothetical protein [Alkalicoccobacillus plakortidis]|uniref:Bacteriophage HK97-gp10 tail-component n=1 Tax=Alkalicoccobacillus plakortidis TaxID=444060 RepID=A0ABT0XI50_9BACI|nr:hypothetical protein [Alkalicoccobacillus plakortidis]MCM2675581.1 hypothetical protein [Alkalicoccobacillus plakortidis]
MAELESRFGQKRMREIKERAVESGAMLFAQELRRQLMPYKDTGTTINEITVSKPYYVNGEVRIKIHWRGPKGRYRIIHLNEWGTIRNPSPSAKGAIARALQSSEKVYRDAVKKAIIRGMRQ